MAPFRGSNFKSKITTSYKVLWIVFRNPLLSNTCGRAPTKSFRSSSWTTLPASAMVQFSHFLAAKTRSGTVNIKVMLSSDLNVVNMLEHWKRQFYFEGHYIGIWKANHLTVFFLKVTYFGSQHRKWPSRTFVDFVLEKMELARVVDWFAWLEISWRIWRKEKSCQLPQLWFLDSVHSSFLPSQRLVIVASPLILHRRRQIFIAFYFQIFNYPRKHFSLQILFFALFVYIARWSG